MTTGAQFDRSIARKRAFLRASIAMGGGLIVGIACASLGMTFFGILVVIGGLIAGWQMLNHPGGVPILVYHSVAPDAGWLPWATNTSIRPEVLDIHLRTLERKGWVIVPTTDLIAARRGGPALPPRAVILQFDDAYLDNYLFAAPLLRKYKAPATFFVSVDFVALGDTPRTIAAVGGVGEVSGYMNPAELRALDADPLFAIEAHGTDHGRIPISDRIVGHIGTNWKQHAPLIWSAVEGNKSDWFQDKKAPSGLTARDPLPEADSALAGRWWRNGASEDDSAFSARVGGMLARAYFELSQIIGRKPQIMCWPFDRSDPLSISAALKVGFTAVTGGRGENRPGDDPAILARVHVQDRAFGGGPLWLEALALKARVNSAAGHWAWHPIVVLARRIRRLRLGSSGYGASES